MGKQQWECRTCRAKYNSPIRLKYPPLHLCGLGKKSREFTLVAEDSEVTA